MLPAYDFRSGYRSPFAEAFVDDSQDSFAQYPFAHDHIFFHDPLFAHKPAHAGATAKVAEGSVLAPTKELAPAWGEYFSRAIMPACHVTTRDNEYVVNCDVPGVRKEDLKIEVGRRCTCSSMHMHTACLPADE